jgi:hypothetical protein
VSEHEPTFENEEQKVNTEQYIQEEIEATKKSLLTTQIVGSAVVVVLFFYLGSIALRFQQNLEPSEAATITKGIIVQKVDEAAPQFTSYIKEQTPALIRQVPDYAIEQLPGYREQVEQKLETQFLAYCEDTSDELSKSMDDFLAANQDSFEQIMLTGTDEQETNALAENLRVMFVDYLQNESDGGETISYKLNEALNSLHEIERKTTRLATASDLTPQEQKTRKAIAVMLSTIDNAGLPQVESLGGAEGEVAFTEEEVTSNPVSPRSSATPRPLKAPNEVQQAGRPVEKPNQPSSKKAGAPQRVNTADSVQTNG